MVSGRANQGGEDRSGHARRASGEARNALKAIRTIVFLALFLVYAGYVLAQFPSTRGLSSNMATFALGPLDVIVQGVLRSVPGLMFLAVLFVVLRLVRGPAVLRRPRARCLQCGDVRSDWAQPTYKIIRIIVIAFGLVVAAVNPGRPVGGVSGNFDFCRHHVLTRIVHLIANIVAGYMLIYRRAFKLGDIIKVGEHFGEVVTTRLRVTHLRSPKNEEIVIPNSQMLNSEVVNFSSIGRRRGLILHTEVAIGYSTPWRQVEAMLIDAAQRTQGLGAGGSSVRVRETARRVRRDLRAERILHERQRDARALCGAACWRVLDVFNEHGVQIMTPAAEGDPSNRWLPRRTGSRPRPRRRRENAPDRRA